jgi:hypothetical protein
VIGKIDFLFEQSFKTGLLNTLQMSEWNGIVNVFTSSELWDRWLPDGMSPTSERWCGLTRG